MVNKIHKTVVDDKGNVIGVSKIFVYAFFFHYLNGFFTFFGFDDFVVVFLIDSVYHHEVTVLKLFNKNEHYDPTRDHVTHADRMPFSRFSDQIMFDTV